MTDAILTSSKRAPTRQKSGSQQTARRQPVGQQISGQRDREFDLANYLVPPAMLVAATAMGVASYLHLGIGMDMAIAVGATLFCAMLLCHILLRAADIADRAEEEAAERRAEQIASPMPSPDRLTADQPPAEMDNAAESAYATRPSDPISAEEAEFGRGLGAVAAQDTAHMAVVDLAAAAPPLEAEHTRPARIRVTGQAAAAPESAAQPALDTDARPLAPTGWMFRPVDLRLPSVEPVTEAGSEAAAVAAAIGNLRPTIVDQAAPTDQTPNLAIPEADRIDAILKRLAREIKAGTEPSQPARDIAVGSTDLDSLAAIAARHPDTSLESAVDALRSTVEAMRQGSSSAEAGNSSPVAQPPNAVEARIAAVAEALAVERVDVVLAPILALEGAEARHFEVSVRLRAADGELIDARGVAESIASGAGLLPLLDALSVRHAAGFALKLERRGRAGAVFSTVAGASLESDGFVGDVAGRYAQGIADRMVLSFAQAEMRGLGPAQLAALGELADLGFRFALTGVADLDMDFDALKATGFQFVKLDAAIFLGGLPCGGQIVPASDLCMHFADLGIEVIVSGIGDEGQRDNLVGCGVAFGQGPLYGDPRPIPFATQGALAA